MRPTPSWPESEMSKYFSNLITRTAWPIGCLIALTSLATRADEPKQADVASPEILEWFEREVRPLLAEHCYSCHSSTVEQPKGGLRLDSREGILTGGDSGPAASPGKADASLIIDAVRRQSLEMPPDKSLNPRDQATLTRWVELGLPWPKTQPSDTHGTSWVKERAAVHWAWHTPHQATPPESQDDNWSRKPLDRFIASELIANDLRPTLPCDSLTLLRRLSFDITGLPPTEHDVAEFSQFSDSSTEFDASVERLIDRLLSSPQFGIQWGRHWLDLVRYSETLGHEFDYPVRNAWQYRDATIDGLNVDLSYADWIREHLAGDQLPQPRIHPTSGVNQSLAATGWWWMGDSIHAPVDIRNDLATRTDNQIDVFSKAFLGMTVACARCHDHKFDAISLKDYYGLSGVMQSSRRIYHRTDPLGKIAQHQTAFTERRDAANALARQALGESAGVTSELRAWLANLVQSLRSQPDKLDALVPLNSPWFALRPLLNDEFAESIKRSQTQISNHQSSYSKWLSESVLFADLRDGLPVGWSLQTAANNIAADFCRSSQPQTAEFDWFGGKLPVPSVLGQISSQRLGRKTDVTLRSPSFTVEHPVICLKMKGKATSMISVDNYYMHEFTGLLFGDLRKGFDQPQDSGWVTHGGDLKKYLGHPAFISLEDEDAGWFEIKEVRFADRGPPLEPSQLAIDVLSGEFTSPAELFDQIESRLLSALKSLGTDQADANSVTWVRSAMELAEKVGVAMPLMRAGELASAAEQLQQLDASTPASTMLVAVSEGSPVDSAIALRGNANQSGDIVPRGCFDELISGPEIGPTSSGRWELAQAMTSPDHPLTSRVIVNRVWHHLFGKGLVNSTDNLGVLGGRPTHPMLLDYLSNEFVKHDWSIKWLIHEIVSSETYRMSSTPTPEQLEKDADGRLWSHRIVKRLTAESLRDSLLSTSGSLVREIGGPSTAIHLTEEMTGRGRPGSSGPLDGSNRRSIFIEVRRNFLDPFLLAFDFPMPSTSTGNRNVSNVPAQALGLLNAPLVDELAIRWARRILSINGDQQRIDSMFVTAFGRQPTPKEMEDCLEMVSGVDQNEQQQMVAWTDLAHVLFNAKEFSYVR